MVLFLFQIDWPTMMALKAYWFFGAAYRSSTVGRIFLGILIKLRIMHQVNKGYMALMNRCARIMRESDVDWDKARAIPIPEYDWKNGNPEEFYNTYVKRPHPVILRGFLKGTKIMEEYTFDKMVEKFGEETVLLTTPEQDGILGKLKEVDNPSVYLHNSEVLLKKYPEIIDAFESHRLEPYVKKTNEYSQFFIGRQGTGTPLHNASNSNMFLMVDGSKRWYFIDPYDTYLAHPFYVWGGAAAMLLALFPDEYDESVMPAFKYCPYYYGDLNPGDVLHNPPWWCHGIRNTGEKTVGVATRWLTGGLVGAQLTSMEEDYNIHRWASFNFMTGPNSIPFMHQTLKESTPSYDEFSTVRERDTRYSHQQIAAATGKVMVDGWRPIF